MSNIDWHRIAYIGDCLSERDYYQVGDYNLLTRGYEYYLLHHISQKSIGSRFG